MLLAEGHPVPPAFVLLSAAYSFFLRHNSLESDIAAILERIRAGKVSVRGGSSHIRLLIERGNIPPAMEDEIRQEYGGLVRRSARFFGRRVRRAGARRIAVRSSATAEDLPDASFAGLQDTFLDVTGTKELLSAVRRCWSSLWSERAISYRRECGISDEGLSMAVVVQTMVPSRHSGVLFTADPLLGDRDSMLLEYARGKGEDLVSGRIEPLRVHLNRRDGELKEVGGERDGKTSSGVGTPLSRKRIADIFGTGEKIEELFGSPQDIEWAISGGRTYILQSRPVTTLYPLPKQVPDWSSPHVYVSFNAAEGMESPLTPLGVYCIRKTFSRFRTEGMTRDGADAVTSVFVEAGGRIYCDVTPFLRSRLFSVPMRYVMREFFSGEMDGFRELLESAGGDEAPPTPFREDARYLSMPLPAAGNLLRAIISPEGARERYLRNVEKVLSRAESDLSGVTNPQELMAVMHRHLDLVFSRIILPAIPLGMVGAAALWLLERTAGRTGGGADPMGILRGAPHNLTVEMNRKLQDMAGMISSYRADGILAETDPVKLSSMYMRGEMPDALLVELEGFFRMYGHRGPEELDVGRPRWREDMEGLFEILSGFSPPGKTRTGGKRGSGTRKGPPSSPSPVRPGGMRRMLAGWARRRIRALGGLREAPRFYTVKLSAQLRERILAEGERLAQGGVLDDATDIFFLLPRELMLVLAGKGAEFLDAIPERRRSYEGYRRGRRFPLFMTDRGRAAYPGHGIIAESSEGRNVFQCSPVSPGRVRGRVRVLRDPAARLGPGEIIVCRMTNPGWTPLFPSAEGLIMEIGGAATHGAIVAREFGLPAVAGFPNATEILSDGEEIIVDGGTGRVVRVGGGRRGSPLK